MLLKLLQEKVPIQTSLVCDAVPQLLQAEEPHPEKSRGPSTATRTCMCRSSTQCKARCSGCSNNVSSQSFWCAVPVGNRMLDKTEFCPHSTERFSIPGLKPLSSSSSSSTGSSFFS
uniref:Uncharacterized protein n=1 Tax=Sphaerodactylus townsendi TaxID=933632 RepID=A0ACB8FX72_9SAUR